MKKTATEEYRKLINENLELLSIIWKEMLRKMPDKPDWADVGDINHSHESLIELLVHLRNAEDEEEMKKQIENELNNAK
jgi:hypothetical protein